MVKSRLLLLALIVPLLSQAQFKPQKFGKFTPEELNLKVYAEDSSAKAVVLFNKGEFYYSFDNVASDFRVTFRQHKRIKILKKDGASVANISIPMYGNESESKEVISSFKAYTYNSNGGEFEKTKVDKSLIYKENVTKGLNLHKFTFPNVKEGSIIEYEIEITSGYIYNVTPWDFQEDIPVSFSSYEVSIPEYFQFGKQTRGYIPFAINKSTQESKSINFGGTNSLLYTDYTDHLEMVNIPAFKSEPYLDCEDNYKADILYELTGISIPGQVYKNFNSSWTVINKNLLDDSDFGGQLKSKGFFKDDLKALIANDTSQLSKVNKIFYFVKSKVKWNDRYSIWAIDGTKKAYKEGIGNSAQINLLLVAMLKEAGLEAYPVVLSTRSHGFVDFGKPSTSKLDFVIGLVKINDKPVFLDATRAQNGVGSLPFELMNDKGRIIDADSSQWVRLAPEQLSKELHYSLIKIAADGTVSGEMANSYSDVHANRIRYNLLQKNSEEQKKYLQKSISESSIDSIRFENLKTDLEKPLLVKFQYSIPNKASVTGNNIFFNPFIWERYSENPFKLEKRVYPINFGYSWTTRYTAQIECPEGYVVEELPKNIAVATSDKGAIVQVSYAQNANTVTVLYTVTIKKPVFVSSDYDEIKAIYNKIVEKQSEMIVFKKA